MNLQKTLNRQDNLPKNKAGGITVPVFKLCYKVQSPKQYGSNTKTDTWINGTEQRAQKQTHSYTVNLQQRRQDYTMVKRSPI